MAGIRGLTVSVGYAETLRICLPRNMRHMTECWVVTSPDDLATQEVARSVPGVRLSVTDCFTKHGAHFNKGLAIESAGFDVMGRHGQILIHDADILFPDSLPLPALDPAILYGVHRRILENPANWKPDLNWLACPPSRDGSLPIGFFQLFHADAPVLRGVSPWYDVSFSHSGGGDAAFADHWKRANAPTRILPIDVLHIGPIDTNWFGRDQASRDMMAKFVTENGWRRAAAKFDRAAVERAGEYVERVKVPGYPDSTYELPFVRRAQARPQ